MICFGLFAVWSVVCMFVYLFIAANPGDSEGDDWPMETEDKSLKMEPLLCDLPTLTVTITGQAVTSDPVAKATTSKATATLTLANPQSTELKIKVRCVCACAHACACVCWGCHSVCVCQYVSPKPNRFNRVLALSRTLLSKAIGLISPHELGFRLTGLLSR